MTQSHTRTVPWLSFAHLPNTATVRWLPSRSTVPNNIVRLPWSDINVRWRAVMAVLQIRSGTCVTRSMESLPISWIPLAHRRWCDENHKPPLLFTLRGSAQLRVLLLGSVFLLAQGSVSLIYMNFALRLQWKSLLSIHNNCLDSSGLPPYDSAQGSVNLYSNALVH